MAMYFFAYSIFGEVCSSDRFFIVIKASKNSNVLFVEPFPSNWGPHLIKRMADREPMKDQKCILILLKMERWCFFHACDK